MLKQALDFLVDLGRTTKKPSVTPVPGDGRQQIITYGDKAELVDVRPEPVSCHAGTWESLVDVVKQYRGSEASIWCGKTEIVGVLDVEDRRDCVRFKLEFSELWKRLTKTFPCSLDQRGVIKLLKQQFGPAVDAAVINAFRSITFARQQGGESTIQRDGESLGRSIEQKVQGTSDIPETFVIRCPVYEIAGLTLINSIRIDVDIHHGNETFELVVLPDEMDVAMQQAQQHIRDVLSGAVSDDEQIHVFSGSPF